MSKMIAILFAVLLTAGLSTLFQRGKTVSTLAQPEAMMPLVPRKRALLVGVSDYCRDPTGAECNRLEGKYFWNLNSKNDVEAIAQILMSDEFGFKRDDIKILNTKAETTRDNIINTFKSFLVEPTTAGDIVYFHFSGHGTRVRDDQKQPNNLKPGDELDGMDESLVPSDYRTTEDGSQNIRDDELEQLLTKLSGRNVTVTVDACYSGTITRGGSQLIRGRKLSGSFTTNRNGSEDGPSGLFSADASLPNNLVVISAARIDQAAQEAFDPATNRNMGAFSRSLVKALKNAGPETTYRNLFETICDELTNEIREQNPQLEGGRDTVLFSGTVLSPKSYINLKVDNRKVTLQAGSLHGMTKGSRFSLYALGKDSKTGSSLAEGEIVAIGPTMSVLNVTPKPDEKMFAELRTAHAFETFHHFGDARVKVLIDPEAGKLLGVEVLRNLRSLDLVNVADGGNDWEVRICRHACRNEKLSLGQEAAGPGEVTLMRADGSIILRLSKTPNLLDSVKRALEGEARWRFIKGLTNSAGPDLQIRMRLVPVDTIKQDPDTKLAISARDITEEVEPLAGGQTVLHEGQTVMLEVMNLGADEPYVSILDLRSDGTIAPLFPHPQLRLGVNENRIPVKNDKEGKPVWQRIPFPFVIRIGKPYGMEVFKAMLTSAQSDFSPLFNLNDAEDIQTRRSRGSTRGNAEAQSRLGQLLLIATTGKKGGRGRGARDGVLLGAPDASNTGVPLEGWSTAEILFQALPPKAPKVSLK
jgi:hypothetical protein